MQVHYYYAVVRTIKQIVKHLRRWRRKMPATLCWTSGTSSSLSVGAIQVDGVSDKDINRVDVKLIISGCPGLFSVARCSTP